MDELEPLALTSPPNPKPRILCSSCFFEDKFDNYALGEKHVQCTTTAPGKFVLWFEGDSVNFDRAGDCVCTTCRRRYLKHPMAYGPAAQSHSGEAFLHVLCDGRLVKL